MIEIRMETKKLKLTMKGHALPEESEQYNGICNAAGALAQAMVYAFIQEKDGALVKEMDYRPESGDLMARIWPENGRQAEAENIFRIYGYGLELLAKSHGYSVEMIWDGRKIIPDKEEKRA